nr:winged helix-turn-helix DNA-binding domain, heat shock transcription factor family [Tanacetum cinerariifolium]
MLTNLMMQRQSPSGLRSLPSDTVANPRGNMKAITTRSGVAYEGPSIPPTSSFLPKEVEREPEVTKDKSLLSNKEKLLELASTSLNENCLVVLRKKLPKKLRDPDKFLIPCDFSELEECLALADLGASINLMPLSVWKKRLLSELTPTRMTLELTNRLVAYPVGVAEDVFVKIRKFRFLANFVVVDYDVDPQVPFILGSPFLKMARALIDVHGKELTLRVNDEAITFEVRHTSRYSCNYDDESSNQIDVIDVTCEKYAQEVLGFSDSSKSGSPTPSDLIIASSPPSFTPFEEGDFILEEIETFLRTPDEISNLDDDYYDTKGDILYLEKLLNEDPSPNLPPMKNEDHNPWVSPIHCMPKKGGMTVVKNEDNELIPTRLVTGWREESHRHQNSYQVAVVPPLLIHMTTQYQVHGENEGGIKAIDGDSGSNGDIDLIIDLVDIEEDLESMYDQFEVYDSDIEGLTMLSDLREKVATVQGCRGDRACKRGDGRRVPLLLHKLYNMVEKQEIDDVISWNLPYHDSFIIWDINKFAAHAFKKVCWKRHEPCHNVCVMEIEIFMNRLKATQQEQESKIIWLSYYEKEMKVLVNEFKKMVINITNNVNKMISKSNETLENAKKGKLVIEDNGIGSTNGQHSKVDERGEHNASKDNNNTEAQSSFQGLQINLEVV